MALRLTTNDKPSKAAAYQLIREARVDGRPLTDHALDMLINYFAPARPREPKTAEEWVAKACAGKDEVRYHLRYMHVSGGVAYGTDGNRLHWCDTSLPDGFYLPLTLDPCECEGRFPDVLRVIPDALSGLDHSTGMEQTAVSYNGKTRVASLAKGTYVNEMFWVQALGGDMLATYSVDPGLKCRGRNRFGEFVIMPVRVK